MISSLVHIYCYLRELFQINWLVLETSKMFHAYSDAKRSLSRLWHAMLDVILVIFLVVIVVSWLASNSWECLMCHWNYHVLFPSYKIFWYSLLMLYWVDLAHSYIMLWLQISHLKPLWSFRFRLIVSLYALINIF